MRHDIETLTKIHNYGVYSPSLVNFVGIIVTYDDQLTLTRVARFKLKLLAQNESGFIPLLLQILTKKLSNFLRT